MKWFQNERRSGVIINGGLARRMKPTMTSREQTHRQQQRSPNWSMDDLCLNHHRLYIIKGLGFPASHSVCACAIGYKAHEEIRIGIFCLGTHWARSNL